MKLEMKAYKCTFPHLFTEAYNGHMWQDPKQYEVIFGKTQKEAVRNRCMMSDTDTYWELKQNINTQRFPDADLYSQDKSTLLSNLTSKEIGHLTHSLGVEIGGVDPIEFYRNFSAYYEKHEECEKLVKLGLMENWQKFESEVYGVSVVGIKAVKTLLLCNKSNLKSE